MILVFVTAKCNRTRDLFDGVSPRSLSNAELMSQVADFRRCDRGNGDDRWPIMIQMYAVGDVRLKRVTMVLSFLGSLVSWAPIRVVGDLFGHIRCPPVNDSIQNLYQNKSMRKGVTKVDAIMMHAYLQVVDGGDNSAEDLKDSHECARRISMVRMLR